MKDNLDKGLKHHTLQISRDVIFLLKIFYHLASTRTST